jgi:hypothetical protein
MAAQSKIEHSEGQYKTDVSTNEKCCLITCINEESCQDWVQYLVDM